MLVEGKKISKVTSPKKVFRGGFSLEFYLNRNKILNK